MTDILELLKNVAKQVHSIILDYPHIIAIFRERAKEVCSEYLRYLVAIEKVNPAECTDEEIDNPDTMLDIDETALKTIPRDPIHGSGGYYRLPATKKEELNEQYTALAVLHDHVLREQLQEDGVILRDKSFACLMVQKSIIGNKAYYDDKFYQDALTAVEEDLPLHRSTAGGMKKSREKDGKKRKQVQKSVELVFGDKPYLKKRKLSGEDTEKLRKLVNKSLKDRNQETATNQAIANAKCTILNKKK